MKHQVLVILRHENSLNVVREFCDAQNIETRLVALDPVEVPEDVQSALSAIRLSVQQGVNAVILGTKVYDTIKSEKTDPPVRLIEFLALLHEWGINQIPVCLTHLADMPNALINQIKDTGLNVSWVENDNLKRDGMSNLGPLLLKALSL